MSTLLVTAIGAVGALCVLLAFGAQVSGRLDGRGLPFHLLNAAGAGAMIVSGCAVGAWPSAGVNIVWTLISLTWIVLLVRGRRPDGTHFEPPTAELRPATREYTLPTAELRLPTAEYATLPR